MVTRTALLTYLDKLLQPEHWSDYCPNGLQVEGKDEIRTVVSGVSACQALIDKAIELKADALLVHHGYFWKGESAEIVGIKRKRLQALLAHDINLIAYHLPLDAHATFGNNAQLAQKLGWTVEGDLLEDKPGLIMMGRSSIEDVGGFKMHLAQHLQTPLHIEGQTDTIRKIVWCTGAAQSFIDEAIKVRADAYITGEVSEPTVHSAREAGIHFFACGHHATERFGVQALGAHLGQHFGLTHQFVDIPNPV